MILDNERQREIILSMIDVVPLYGTRSEVIKAVTEIDELAAKVKEAEIEINEGVPCKAPDIDYPRGPMGSVFPGIKPSINKKGP
jgi:hypothetical protein